METSLLLRNYHILPVPGKAGGAMVDEGSAAALLTGVPDSRFLSSMEKYRMKNDYLVWKSTFMALRCTAAALCLHWVLCVLIGFSNCCIGQELQLTSTAANNPKFDEIYHDGWIDLNKNGKKDPYEDSSLSVDQRAEDLLSRMSLEEKTCQMVTLYGYPRVLKDELPEEKWLRKLWKDGIGNIDEHANGNTNYGRPIEDPKSDLPHASHAETMNDVQRFFIEKTRLGIPADFTNEGVRGLLHSKATCFPSPLGVAATWNLDLVGEIGRITAVEAKALGYTHIYAPILDLPRDPRWGRTCECYSEDPFLTAECGVAMVQGLQAHGVASTCKHFAVYGVPNGGRDGAARTDPQVTWQDVQTMHLHPFREVVQRAHPMGMMASYNDYNGTPAQASYQFLTEILRNEWGFDGYVVSDSGAVQDIHKKHRVADSMKEAVRQSVEAGLNVRTNFSKPEHFVLPLRELVQEGRVSQEVLNSRVRDVLKVKFRLGLFDQPYVNDPKESVKAIGTPDSQEIALQVARESIVLLKNENQTLPLKKSLKRILVTGPLADHQQAWWDRYGPQRVDYITPLEGIQQKLAGQCEVVYALGCPVVDERYPASDVYQTKPSPAAQAQIDEAVAAAQDVDVIIAVLGEEGEISRENRGRISLNLPGNQGALLKALHAIGKPVVLVLSSGRPLSIAWADDNLPAILEMWFSNRPGGQALADILFGDYNPSGKLPVTFPKSVGQIPLAFPAKPAAQGKDDGQVQGALYPFGHGLSYTQFTYSDLQILPESQSEAGEIQVSCKVTNSGDRTGEEVVQLYLRDDYSSRITFEKTLQGFQRVKLAPGETQTVSFQLDRDNLELYNVNQDWVVEPGTFTVWVGASSTTLHLEGSITIKPDFAN